MAKRCVLDITAALIAGTNTELDQIIRILVITMYDGDESTLLFDGQRLESGIHGATGDPDNPLSYLALTDKFRRYAQPHLSSERTASLHDICL